MAVDLMGIDLKARLKVMQLKQALIDADCSWSSGLEAQFEAHLAQLNNGNLERWLAAIAQMPGLSDCNAALDQDCISIHSKRISDADTKRVQQALEALIPWRKGPFDLFGTPLNTEWRSDAKWSRLQAKIAPLKGKVVLDVGCGNGYFSLRMAGVGAKLVVGVDPSWLFMAQFMAISQYLKPAPAVYLLPFTLEQVPQSLASFDSVFSMGVIYHRRSPIDHLLACLGALKPGGQLVLETLVVGPDKQTLVPTARYARMRNVWFIPSVAMLSVWLERVGFDDIELLDESVTTLDEQRSTAWMPYESLEQCLDPSDHSRTVEGHPAPRRAVIVATKPA